MSITETNDKIGVILKFFKNGTVTDETFQLLEIALKDLQKQAFEIGKQIKVPQVKSQELVYAEQIGLYLKKKL